jgi:hypothetical protein
MAKNIGPEGPFQPWGKTIRDEADRITGKSKVYDKQAADAKANRKESEAEVSKQRFDRAQYNWDKSATPKGK